jgi:hypothetical protein
MAWAAGSDVSARAEISHLLTFLAQCGCQFNRNGSLHTDRQAAAHLQGKWDYLNRAGISVTADQFIDKVASRSSLSGEPYLMQCQGSPPVDAGKWLKEELQRLRLHTTLRPPSPANSPRP